MQVMEAERVLPSSAFVKTMEEKSGQRLLRCYQCTKCSAGCPMAFAMDILPHQIVRLSQLGLKDDLLKSESIWVCSGCATCKSRCPNDIDIAALNDALKAEALAAGYSDKKVAKFHEAFLGSLKRNGRLHELGMMLDFKLKTGTYTQDLPMGLVMFTKGTLKLLPERIRSRQEIQAIFEASKEQSQ